MSTNSTQVPLEEPKQYSRGKPLAKSIGVCSKTLSRWADAGYISRRKINGRVVIYDVAETHRFIESCRVTSASA